MGTALHILGLLLLFAFCAASLASLLFGLPGTFFILGAALVYAWASGFAQVTWATIGWLALMAVVAEGIEFLAGAASAAGEKPSWRLTLAVIAGGLIGGIVGTPFLLGIGSLIGALLGAFAGASLAVMSEGGTFGHAYTAGIAALRGRFLGFVVKSAIAAAMIIVVAVAAI